MTFHTAKPDFTTKQEEVLAGFYFTYIISKPKQAETNPNDPSQKIVTLETAFTLEDLVSLQQFILFYQLLSQAQTGQGDFTHIFKTADGYGLLGAWTKPNLNLTAQTKLLDTVVNKEAAIAHFLAQAVMANDFYDRQEHLAQNKQTTNFTRLYDPDVINSTSFIYHLLTATDLVNLVAHIIASGWQKDHFVPNQETKQIAQTWLEQFPPSVANNYMVLENGDNENMKLRLLIKRKDLQYLQTYQMQRLNKFVIDCFTSPKANAAGIPLWINYNYQTQELSADINRH